jgi:hypothetical protein
VQLAPFALPIKLKFCDVPNGALNVCDPPQEFVSVRVPDDGGLVYEIDPVIVYELSIALQDERLPVNPVKLQLELDVGAT